jgi:RimJ/RimL family protein N-acetyltransferase
LIICPHAILICYFVRLDNQLVGSAGIKGPPVNNRIEIAYGTFPALRRRGIGAEICRTLVNLSLKTDPRITISARTLPERNFSARILEKNNFRLLGNVWDEDDGDVWEWEYQQQPVNF